jgi:uncharacterized repeat protein (TIGR01451 family)
MSDACHRSSARCERRRRVLGVGRKIAVSIILLGAALPIAFAYQQSTTAFTGTTGVNASTSTTMPGGVVVTFAAGGANVRGVSISTNHSFYAAQSSSYTPNIAVGSPATRFATFVEGCPTTAGECANRGTLTISFSRPVRNPVLHIAGLGGGVGAPLSGSIFRVTSSVPAGVTIGTATGLNLTTTGTTQFANTNITSINGGGNCTTGADTAGCGSIPIIGTVSSVTFTIGLNKQAGTYTTSEFDGYTLNVTTPEDFGDAPATFDTPTPAANHTVGDLSIGANVTVDNATVANAAASPLASAGANADSDDFVWPNMSQGQPAAVTVPLAGASAAGTLCGWVDFDNSGAFAVGERVCQSFASGATSAILNFNVPAAAVVGNRMGRLRAVYGSTLPGSTGRVDSGEVEDALVQILPTANVSVTKTNTPGSGPTDQGSDTVTRGTAINYSIVVSNAGPSAANGSVLHDPAPTGLTCTAVTCGSQTGGAVCPAVTVAALQSAAGVTIATLPANSSLTFTLTCTVN